MKKNKKTNEFNIQKHQEKYGDEVKKKYGESEAYQESQKRTSAYTKENWITISKESNEIYQKLARNMDKNPSDGEVQRLVEEWRTHISTYYYECTLEIFKGLGNMYVSDGRFMKNIDAYKTGLAVFLSEAIHIYCNQHNE